MHLPRKHIKYAVTTFNMNQYYSAHINFFNFFSSLRLRFIFFIFPYYSQHTANLSGKRKRKTLTNRQNNERRGNSNNNKIYIQYNNNVYEILTTATTITNKINKICIK